ncbi:hypothetical protein [Rhabdaerophilum calidifontis]|uniref:hypothetical protein n=1 Tax=Rhabdaerophilum calidifontis TaxID=2604328 RepID=UPI0012396778|nr:hypothetical protein [Rhabdaerophilum calidifontis]
MLTVIIDARPDPAALAATIAPLVRGVVEGIVGGAVLVAPAADRAVEEIADAAGCRVLVASRWPEGFARAVAGAGGSGFLLVDTGLLIGPEFWPILADRLPLLQDRPAVTRPAARPGFAGMAARAAAILRETGGRAGRDRALLLPPRRAREIAAAKADPFAHPFGRDLVRLDPEVRRLP